MAWQQQAEPGYVEPWDKAEFPYYRDRSGLRFWRERVVATGDGEVLRGQLTVANAIAEAWCKDNPVLFAGLIDAWIENARAVDDSDKESRRREEERLGYNVALAEELRSNPGKVFQRAGLTAHELRAMELRMDGKSFAEIAYAFSIKAPLVKERVDKAIEKILALIPSTPELNSPVLVLVEGHFQSQTQLPC